MDKSGRVALELAAGYNTWDDFFKTSGLDAVRACAGNVWVVWNPQTLVLFRRLTYREAIRQLCAQFDRDGPDHGYNAMVSDSVGIWLGPRGQRRQPQTYSGSSAPAAALAEALRAHCAIAVGALRPFDGMPLKTSQALDHEACPLRVATQENQAVQLTLSIAKIVQGKNPREYFDPDEMAELEEGIRAFGVIEPIIVRPVPGTDLFELIAGERRCRAAKNVFGDTYDMPVVIREASDADSEAIALIENYHRAGMSVAEEARTAQRQLLRNRGDKAETARNLGWSRDVLEGRLALMACTPAVLKALAHRQIMLGHAELLAGVPPEKQDTVLSAIVAHKVPVAVLKAQLGQYVRRLADAIFDTAPCTGCSHNSARQAGLFSESLGEGYCQHPTHFDELTLQAVDARAAALKDEYPVIRVVKITDGFESLPVSAEGAFGVGDVQYASCQGCESFGCAVSAMPGSCGAVTRSLCFDADCNSLKVAAWRKVQRETVSGPAPLADRGLEKGRAHKGAKRTPGPVKPAAVQKASNQTPQRVVDHRIAQWRRWVANALMTQPERNHRVLIALALAGRGSDLRSEQFAKVADKLAGAASRFQSNLGGHLRRAHAIEADRLDKLVHAVTASAAFGVDVRNLELLLSYLEVDEARCFQLDKAFLDLFTMSELESLADELGLKRVMGQGFKAVRAGKKAEFIAALLAVKGFEYRGAVPQVMRYPRHDVIGANIDEQQTPPGDTGDGTADAQSDEETQALAA